MVQSVLLYIVHLLSYFTLIYSRLCISSLSQKA